MHACRGGARLRLPAIEFSGQKALARNVVQFYSQPKLAGEDDDLATHVHCAQVVARVGLHVTVAIRDMAVRRPPEHKLLASCARSSDRAVRTRGWPP